MDIIKFWNVFLIIGNRYEIVKVYGKKRLYMCYEFIDLECL